MAERLDCLVVSSPIVVYERPIQEEADCGREGRQPHKLYETVQRRSGSDWLQFRRGLELLSCIDSGRGSICEITHAAAVSTIPRLLCVALNPGESAIVGFKFFSRYNASA
jgi:hypothetical protein